MAEKISESSGLNRAAAGTPAAARERRDWSAAPLPELAAHILARHHGFMWKQLPRLGAALERVLAAHGGRHGRELRAVQAVYTEMEAALIHHLLTEEELVFPQIISISPGAGPRRDGWGTELLRPHLEHLEEEHRAASRELGRLREAASGYRLPGDACAAFRGLYEGLEAMEADLHEHIRLENHILFPRARRPVPGPGRIVCGNTSGPPAVGF
jgi:regulator of cell morphogenesis and NO signaling